MCAPVQRQALERAGVTGCIDVEDNDCTCPKPAIVEMTDDDERRKWTCCCQPCYDLLINLGLLKPNTGMSTSLLNFDSRRTQTDHSTAIPRQHAQDEASPVLQDYIMMRERPSNSLERRLIARHARTLPSAVVQERIVRQQPAAYIHERQEPRYLVETDPEPDVLR